MSKTPPNTVQIPPPNTPQKYAKKLKVVRIWGVNSKHFGL